MKHLTFILIAFIALTAKAQFGYQVSLLDTSTGEPRVNESVTVEIIITNSDDQSIFSDSQKATTDDFGVLSLTIGDEHTFDNVDWTKFPFFISTKVEDITIAKSQILSVPIAEFAKSVKPLDMEKVLGRWNAYEDYVYLEIKSGTVIFGEDDPDDSWHRENIISFITNNAIGGHKKGEGSPFIIYFNDTLDWAFYFSKENARTFYK